ncbi:hypothetical protein PATA110616_23195 [Paenibacillus tarimensis]
MVSRLFHKCPLVPLFVKAYFQLNGMVLAVEAKNRIGRHAVTQRLRMNRGEGCDGVDDREAVPRIVHMERLHHFPKRQVLMLQRLADGGFDASEQRFQRSLAAYGRLDHQDVMRRRSPIGVCAIRRHADQHLIPPGIFEQQAFYSCQNNHVQSQIRTAREANDSLREFARQGTVNQARLGRSFSARG